MNEPASYPHERRATPRAGVADAWRAAQRDAWRLELLKEQVAEEMRNRRTAANLRLAVLAGVGIGILGCGFSLFL